MSDPTFVPLYTGDVHDDDGQIIDDTLIPNGLPSLPTGTAAVVHHEKEPFKPTQLAANTNTFTTATEAIQVAWKDENRLHLKVRIFGAVADYLYIADNPTKLAKLDTGSHVATKMLGGDKETFHDHTGSLWVKLTVAPSAPLEIAVTGVTK